MSKDGLPYIVLTVLFDASARPAALTQSHGNAFERALTATRELSTAGLAIVELPVPAPAFGALRKVLKLAPGTIGLYDIFPLAPHLTPEVRKVAAQFLAAEAIWTLEEQGQLGGVPLNLKLDLPKGWDRDPKAVHKRLVDAGALDLGAAAIETYKTAKERWDAISTIA